MDRETLHTLIDAAIDAMDCEGCREQLIELVAKYTAKTVGEATAVNLSVDVKRGTLTVVEAYDQLTAVVQPIYALAGEDVPQDEIALVRQALLKITTRSLN